MKTIGFTQDFCDLLGFVQSFHETHIISYSVFHVNPSFFMKTPSIFIGFLQKPQVFSQSLCKKPGVLWGYCENPFCFHRVLTKKTPVFSNDLGKTPGFHRVFVRPRVYAGFDKTRFLQGFSVVFCKTLRVIIQFLLFLQNFRDITDFCKSLCFTEFVQNPRFLQVFIGFCENLKTF